MRNMLRNILDGKGPWAHLKGQSQHGGSPKHWRRCASAGSLMPLTVAWPCWWPSAPRQRVEFTRKVLTSGPDGGPLSYRSAKDLAQRNYMTDYPGALRPGQRQAAAQGRRLHPVPQAHRRQPRAVGQGGCRRLYRHRLFCRQAGWRPTMKPLKADAQAKGRKIITGREARELMPTEGATPKGYILLDKPKKGSTEPMREVLGQEVPQSKVVLIETPTGGVVEAAVRAAGEALQAKGQAARPTRRPPSPPKTSRSRDNRWRGAAIAQIIETLKNDPPSSIDPL